MRRIGVAELKDHLSRYLRAAESGIEVEVTDRDRPIARIVPAQPTPEITVKPARTSFADVRRRRYPRTRWAKSSIQLLLEERENR